jgi:hypothetical protein
VPFLAPRATGSIGRESTMSAHSESAITARGHQHMPLVWPGVEPQRRIPASMKRMNSSLKLASREKCMTDAGLLYEAEVSLLKGLWR